MKKNYLFQNTIKAIFLLFYIYTQISCQNFTESKLHNETNELFIKHYITFNTTIKEKFSNVTKKSNTVKFNVILKMKYNLIKARYETMSKTISLLQQLIAEKNWNNDNKRKFDYEIQNLEKEYTQFNSLFTGYNKSFRYYNQLYKELEQFLKFFFTILFTVVFLVLTCVAVISYFVIKKQKKYYHLKEEVSVHANLGKNSDSTRINHQTDGRKQENVQILEQKKGQGSSSKDEILKKDSTL